MTRWCDLGKEHRPREIPPVRVRALFGPVIKIQLTGGMGHTLSAEEGNMSTCKLKGVRPKSASEEIAPHSQSDYRHLGG